MVVRFVSLYPLRYTVDLSKTTTIVRKVDTGCQDFLRDVRDIDELDYESILG